MTARRGLAEHRGREASCLACTALCLAIGVAPAAPSPAARAAPRGPRAAELQQPAPTPPGLPDYALLRWLRRPPEMTLARYLDPAQARFNYQTIVGLRILSIAPDAIVLTESETGEPGHRIPYRSR